jgi:SAM-dependent methyltransferase
MDIARLDHSTLVSILYQALLNRQPDSDGLEHYTGKLDAGASTLHQVALEIVGGNEFVDKYTRSSQKLNAALLQIGYTSEEATTFLEYIPPPSEARKAYHLRLGIGLFARYCRGNVVLDVGFTGYQNPEKRTALPGAIGVDLDYPGYDGLHLPWPANSVDCVFSSHCLEHVAFPQEAIRDWHRVIKTGGYIVCIVPSRDLYEKKAFPPSRYNADHKRFYTTARLIHEFEQALDPNSFRVRHVHDNDYGYDYSIPPEEHAVGCYEIELVVEKIDKPLWNIR